MIDMLFYAILTIGALTPGDGAEAARPAMDKAACEASLALIRSQVATSSDPVIYSEWKGSAEQDFDLREHEWSPTPYAKAHRVPVPTGRRIGRSLHLGNLRFSAVRHCRSVRHFLDRHHIPYGTAATDRAVQRQDRKATFISVALAAVDVSGRYAVVTFGSTGFFGGGGWATVLVRDHAGRWHPAYSTPTWIT
ncbi:hypothetical protein [uncultured Sphingomonas sp.]|uniref:hypothetical protein n=1 Tax=uncultured Sphingomonas sp. TaxID=158754 RepID=UPI0025F89D10|nr:hypothetical protein [uncultured Sphingomonas sp.]